MKSKEILQKYIERNFNLDTVKIEYKTDFLASVILIDGNLDLICLGDTVAVAYNGAVIERSTYNDISDVFYIKSGVTA